MQVAQMQAAQMQEGQMPAANTPAVGGLFKKQGSFQIVEDGSSSLHVTEQMQAATQGQQQQ